MVRIKNPLYGGSFQTDHASVLPFVLPGEKVLLEQDLPQVLEFSPERVSPRCVHFGVCGGCHYQHSTYANQLELKRQVLADTLAQAGLLDLPPICTHSGPPWEYRNRIRIRLEPALDGLGVRPGYSRRTTNDFLPITMCPIASPLLWRAVETLVQCASGPGAVARWLRSVAEVELFCNAQESHLQLQFYLSDAAYARAEPQTFQDLWAQLRHALPELSAAAAELAPELDRRTRRTWPGQSWGAPGIPVETATQIFWVSRGAFFQVNRYLVDRLVALVAKYAGGGSLAWDLFAGVGLFTLPLAERFSHVVAVEAGDAAAADLLRASRGTKTGRNFTAIHSSAHEFLRAQQIQRERPEVVVLDPPRAGLGAAASAILARMVPTRIVYVSCDPVTLARDLAVLTGAGYAIEALDLIDLFPQTFHLETVVHLSRR